MKKEKSAPNDSRAEGVIVNWNKHPFLGAEVGFLEIVPYYADNEIFGQELRFFVPVCAWNEFQNSPLLRELVDYVQGLAQQTPEMHSHSRDPQYISENPECDENSSCPDVRESLWASVRKKFQKH